ncbi:peptidase domain-containing ABC transporter [Roseivirga thermotolerans]|jgi:ABC-type bacteriocin/lantibiotic exporter with double-glycine peptidase domain|uniref:peptidase domain-containing ABC transporter n=1 Tax=Roseivirga thermotolerans TaxID=1758176 RepID=UPI00273FC721|nr:ATP-binding cassette domain-containing protein [Roseivirga thermotolerans]
MTNQHIANTIKEVKLLLGEGIEDALYQDLQVGTRLYSIDESYEFKRDLLESANKVRVVLLDQPLKDDELIPFLKEVSIPLIALKTTESGFAPVIIHKDKKGEVVVQEVTESETQEITLEELEGRLIKNESGEIILLGTFSYKSLVSEHDEDEVPKPLSPVKRLLRVLGEEKKDIFYVFIYAAFVGIVSLTLPLGIQATVELVSGGVVFSSIYLLIGLVLLGILAAGGLQIMQITLVEYIQRRIFTKAALEFTFRIPRMKVEALSNLHTPELMNRFFDVLTLQKGLPKLLGDLMSGVIQIVFGLLLLSFYHPFFVFFGLVLVLTLVLIFRLTGPKGLESSIQESKYKYKVVYWLEEIARVLNSFKISGNTNLPIKKTEYNVNNYLKNRKNHFRVLITQYSYIVLFKAAITGGLLIIGTSLVINREITLGQFVASEVIIILILNSVEKIITYMDVVYDMLTAVDKISQVTDLPLEKVGGIDLRKEDVDRGFSIEVKDLNYSYPGADDLSLKNINLSIACGTKLCIAGGNESGKTTLTNMLSGLNHKYKGLITINGYSLRDLDFTNLRDKIAKNVSQEDIFEGTILDNVTVGKPQVSVSDAIEAIRLVGLQDKVNMLPNGMNTHILSGGKGYSTSFVSKLILARCLVKKPKLMILNDFFHMFQRSEKLKLIQLVMEMSVCTVVAVSNDPAVMSACDRVVLMEDGQIKADSTYEKLLSKGYLQDLVNG